MSGCVMRIIGLNTGEPCPFDGQLLKEYDPCRDSVSPDGRQLRAHIVTTPNIEEAIHFKDFVELAQCWKQIDKRQPYRADGRPNRPLTAFHITSEPIEGD